MVPLALILGLIGIPLVLGLLLRIQPVLLFVSVLAGYMLIQFLTDDASLALNTVNAHWDNSQLTQIGLFALPTLGSLLFARGSAKHTSGIVLKVVALIATGCLLAVLLQPLLPKNLQAELLTTQVGHNLWQARDLVVGVAILVNCLAMWLGGRHNRSSRSHSKSH